MLCWDTKLKKKQIHTNISRWKRSVVHVEDANEGVNWESPWDSRGFGDNVTTSVIMLTLTTTFPLLLTCLTGESSSAFYVKEKLQRTSCLNLLQWGLVHFLQPCYDKNAQNHCTTQRNRRGWTVFQSFQTLQVKCFLYENRFCSLSLTTNMPSGSLLIYYGKEVVCKMKNDKVKQVVPWITTL